MTKATKQRKPQQLPLGFPALVAGDVPGEYHAVRALTDTDILAAAQAILAQKFIRSNPLTTPAQTREYLRARLATRESEAFCCVFLDNRHRVLAFEELFHGTINGTAVYPREVVKRALALNAAALILVHNHPSGDPQPSGADEQITRRLKEALDLVDVRVLDHLVVGGAEIVSFAERGLL